MVEDLSPPADEQKKLAVNFSLEAIGGKLFPENPFIIRGITDLDPLPLTPSSSPLIIIRANKDGLVQGCLLDLETPSAKIIGEREDSAKNLTEDLCRIRDCSSEAVRGVVIFMEPGANLRKVNGLKEMMNQLSPETQFWFVEPSSPRPVFWRQKERDRKKKEAKLSCLKDLGFVNRRSLRSPTGLPYSTGQLPARKRVQSTIPTQAELELSLQR